MGITLLAIPGYRVPQKLMAGIFSEFEKSLKSLDPEKLYRMHIEAHKKRY